MADADLSGTVLDGRYQVIEPIAEGAMGSVYRGERLKLGRAVAIKIMHQELPDELASRQRFEREAKLMALLEHPNCVSVIDFGVHDDKPFLVMDLVRGTSLIDLMEKTGRLEIQRSVDIIKQVLSGLAHAHELGIVHRDIKPANIMISEKAGYGQQVRILDFGLARLTESSTKLTTGIVVGTPNYMAPEQCKGSDIDARTDLYACGVMLFEMLTGRKPFVADDPIAVVRKHLMEKPPTLASVEPNVDFGALEEVIAKALSKAPKDRYDNAVAMAKALDVAAQSALKSAAAAVFNRAIPDSKAPPMGNQQATMSGWNVPHSESGPVGGPPAAPPNTASPGVAPSGHGPDSSFAPPVTESQFVDAIAPPPGSPLAGPSSGAPVARASSGSSGPTMGSPAPTAAPSGPVPSIIGAPHGFGPDGQPIAPGSGPMSGGSGPTSAASGGSGPTSAASGGSGPTSATGGASGPASATSGGSGPASATSGGTGPANATTASDGAPDRSLGIPPTRPARAADVRKPGQLPFTTKQMAIGGGALLVLIIIIAVVASGGSKPASGAKGSGGKGPVTQLTPPIDDVAPIIERANKAIAADDPQDAVDLLSDARKSNPNNAQLALALGRAYFAKLWWSEGVKNFRDAVRLDPELKSDPEMLKAVLKGFLTTPDVDDRIADFMIELGDPMKAYLQETADKHPNKQLRARARAELRNYR